LAARRAAVVAREIAEGRRLDGARLADAITELRASIVSVVPTQLDWLLSDDADFRVPKSLRVVLLGGAAASPALLERAAARELPILTTYGLTEACSQVTTQPLGTVNRGELGAGRPLEEVEIRLADGKVQLRGPTLFSGYFPARDRRPDEWFETDDYGRLDEHGCLHLLGRSSEKVITGGENVFPADVEPVLERCPGIRQAVVFGVADETWGEIVAAAIVAGPGGPPTDEVLAKHLAENLAPHRRPRRVAVVDAAVTTPAGKVDRKGTAAKALANLRPLERG
jgi:O-succinylbenzoic acid--CoA ligase